MMPFLFLLAVSALLFFALVEMAFTLLMRLPERLEAERESEGDGLASYLDDPLRFFVPARLLRGSLIVLAIVLLGEQVERGWMGAGVLFASGVGIAVGVGQFLPALIVRRYPERVLALLLPAFTAVANIISPLTALIIGVLGTIERRDSAVTTGAETPVATPAGTPAEPAADQSRLLRSVVDFGETLVREVMTPRPDIVAIRATRRSTTCAGWCSNRNTHGCRCSPTIWTTSPVWSW
jgi:CBS domain containing-hemolysin-like protein